VEISRAQRILQTRAARSSSLRIDDNKHLIEQHNLHRTREKSGVAGITRRAGVGDGANVSTSEQKSCFALWETLKG